MNSRGFTLLEVLVALTVFALLASAATLATGHVLGQRNGLQDRLFGAWLADNHIAELYLQAPLAPGQRQISQTMDGRNWTLTETILPAAVSSLVLIEVGVGLKHVEGRVYHTATWLEAVDATH